MRSCSTCRPNAGNSANLADLEGRFTFLQGDIVNVAATVRACRSVA
jgi:hypothetical protein